MSGASLLQVDAAIPEENFSGPEARDQRAKWSFLFLWLFTFAVYARPEDIWPPLGQLHLTFIFALCAGLFYLGALYSGHAPLIWSRELRLVLLLTAWYIAGIPFAYWSGGSIQTLTQVWLKTLFIFFLLTQTLVSLKRIRALLWAIILSELVVTSFSVVQSSTVVWVGDRMQGVNLGILGWNFLGIAAAVTIPYIAAIFIAERSVLKTSVLIAAFLSMMWMLVLTASRGGFLNVVFSIGLTSFLVLRTRARGMIFATAIAIALLVTVSNAPDVFWQRLDTVWNNSDAPQNENAALARASEDDRLDVLTRSIQYTLEHPIFGLGLGNFANVNGAELNKPDAWMGAHNTFTQISSEAGVPALLVFVALLATAVRNTKRISQAIPKDPEEAGLSLMARATVASLLSFTFGAFFAHLAYEYFFFYPVAIAAGIRHIARTGAISPAIPVDPCIADLHMSDAR